MDDLDIGELDGRRLTGGTYFSIVGGSPVSWGGHRAILVEYGVDLVFDDLTVGLGWSQRHGSASLKLVRRSVALDLERHDSRAIDLSRPPWESFHGARVIVASTFEGCGSKGGLRGIELVFNAGPIHVAAATPLWDDPPEILLCSDDVMVGFGEDNPLGSVLRSGMA